MAKRKSKSTKTQKSSSNGRASASNGASGETANRLDQVRELLFGSDRQATDQRFRQLETALHRELDRQENRFEKALAQLHESMQREFASVTKLIESERNQRGEEEAAAAKRLDAAKSSLAQRLTRVDDEHKQRARTLRERMSSTTNKLREEFADADVKMWNSLQEQLAALTASSTDRVALSAMFQQLSKNLLQEE